MSRLEEIEHLNRKYGRKPKECHLPIEDKEGLPRVLIIGDSIAVGYVLRTRRMLEDTFNIHFIPVNGGPTTRGLEMIDDWLGNKKWDIIHFNWGLHDIIVRNGKYQVPFDEYEKNLRLLVERLKQTGAKLIWASSTPIPEDNEEPHFDQPRRNEDVIVYNKIAKMIMRENNIKINDLYKYSISKLDIMQIPKDLHFNKTGTKMLGEAVKNAIEMI